jgi:hypothetical protein
MPEDDAASRPMPQKARSDTVRGSVKGLDRPLAFACGSNSGVLAGHPAGCGIPVKKTAHTVAHHPKPAHHPKAAPSNAQLQKEIAHLQTEITHIKHPPPGKKAKHKATHKHKGTVKHGTKRGLALGDAVACCAAEALAASLRLSGVPVSDADVMALYWHTADDPEAGASILATLEAAWRFGLGGIRPVHYGLAWRDSNPQTPAHSAPTRAHISAWAPAPDSNTAPGHPFSQGSALILGVDLPGPHSVLAADGRWWSWGEPFDPAEWPDAVVEESWAVTWA